jgi:hypothetical protein
MLGLEFSPVLRVCQYVLWNVVEGLVEYGVIMSLDSFSGGRSTVVV